MWCLINVAHVGIQKVQVGKTTGDNASEGVCSDDGRLIAVGLQRY